MIPAIEKRPIEAYVPNPKRQTFDNRLHEAIAKKDEAAVQQLLDERVSLTNLNDAGRPPLHLAILEKCTRIAELLLQSGANIHQRDSDGDQPLICAADRTSTELIELCLTHGAKVNKQGGEGKTPLYYAAIDPACTKLLLDQGADPFKRSYLHALPIHEAADEALDPKTISLQLEQGVPVDAIDYLGHTPLMSAIKSGNYITAEALLLFGADPNVLTFQGRSCLYFAAEKGDCKMIEILFRAGSLVNPPVSPLAIAVEKYHHKAALKLILLGSLVTKEQCEAGNLLNYAVKYNEPELVKFMLSIGVQPNESILRNAYNRTRIQMIKPLAEAFPRYPETLVRDLVNKKGVELALSIELLSTSPKQVYTWALKSSAHVQLHGLCHRYTWITPDYSGDLETITELALLLCGESTMSVFPDEVIELIIAEVIEEKKLAKSFLTIREYMKYMLGQINQAHQESQMAFGQMQDYIQMNAVMSASREKVQKLISSTFAEVKVAMIKKDAPLVRDLLSPKEPNEKLLRNSRARHIARFSSDPKVRNMGFSLLAKELL